MRTDLLQLSNAFSKTVSSEQKIKCISYPGILYVFLIFFLAALGYWCIQDQTPDLSWLCSVVALGTFAYSGSPLTVFQMKS